MAGRIAYVPRLMIAAFLPWAGLCQSAHAEKPIRPTQATCSSR
jgi:hypothetical protein